MRLGENMKSEDFGNIYFRKLIKFLSFGFSKSTCFQSKNILDFFVYFSNFQISGIYFFAISNTFRFESILLQQQTIIETSPHSDFSKAKFWNSHSQRINNRFEFLKHDFLFEQDLLFQSIDHEWDIVASTYYQFS